MGNFIFRYFFSIWLSTVYLSLAPSVSLGDGLNRVEWEELPAKVADKLIPPTSLEALQVYDCLSLIGTQQASRTVLQYIENNFYRWKEYELRQAGALAAFCIEMEAPEAKFLDPYEAQVLLSASRLWQQQSNTTSRLPGRGLPRNPIPGSEMSDREPNVLPGTGPQSLPPDAVIRDALDPELFYPPADGFYYDEFQQFRQNHDIRQTPDNVIASDVDDRGRIANTQIFPFNTIAYVAADQPNGTSFRGTAFLVAPHIALTAGHIVYNPVNGGFASRIQIAPGQFETAAGSVIAPFGLYEARRWETNTTYIGIVDNNPRDGRQFEFDYGVIFLERFVTGISTFMPLVFDVSPPLGSLLNLAGYPAIVRGAFTFGMWGSTGPVEIVEPRLIFADIFSSPGASGSPMWQFSAATNARRIIAIHVCGVIGIFGSDASCGSRLISENQPLINEWLSEPIPTPPPPANPPATGQFGAISLHSQVTPGEGEMAFGFIIEGGSMSVGIRATGPSNPLSGPLPDPVLTVVNLQTGAVIDANDDFSTSPRRAEIIASGFAPPQPQESAVLIDNLPAGSYNALVRDFQNRSGVAFIEVFKLSGQGIFRGVSLHSQVTPGEGEMAFGFILQGAPTNVIMRATGPSNPLSGPLPDPVLTVVNLQTGAVIDANDDFALSPRRAEITARGLAPPQPQESAVLIDNLPAGSYNALVRDFLNRSGVAFIEIFGF